jgi:hypothetical protein
MNKEEFIKVCESKFDSIKSLNELDNFYDYETQFVKLWHEVGRTVLEKNLGELSADKRKKKPYDSGLYNNQ